MDFNNMASIEPHGARRSPYLAHFHPSYNSYEDVRGIKAKNIALAMGITEESGTAFTGYLIELRHAADHIRISAHAKGRFQEVLLFQDTSVITFDIDKNNEEAIQTVYSPNGDIETLMAGWSSDKNGYFTPYTSFSLKTDKHAECLIQWQKYEQLIFTSEQNVTRIGFEPRPR